jgi:hypothetical protein
MKTEKYIEQQARLPKAGKQIIAQKKEDCIVVYQAFNQQIANYAIEQQHFGGPAYSANRMSWIKPGFLWMMYRSGWANKENQERIVAITLPIIHFKTILSEATISSFDKSFFPTEAIWKSELEKTEVRLQWDPDHDPLGNKQERKAIQIGMKGKTLAKFCTAWPIEIEDITPFVKVQFEKLQNKQLDELDLPFEEVINLDDVEIKKRIGIDKRIP